MVQGGMSMINPTMWVNSARNSGYRDAAMALGELIDNSLQAGSTNIEILVKEGSVLSGSRNMMNVLEIGVLDNGKGMDAELVQRALRFGDGDHHADSTGMGKFGVGLPQASISQAKRIDVWSWQNGVSQAKHTFIDLSDSDWVKNAEIYPADDSKIPSEWIKQAKNIGTSGTLIVWSDLDKLAWKKAETIYTNSDFLVGRMYRNWLSGKSSSGEEKADITLTSFDQKTQRKLNEWSFTPNDPLYLLEDNSANPSLETKREILFDTQGIIRVLPFELDNEDGKISTDVKITCTMAPRELRDSFEGKNAGFCDYGKHAKKNIGVSIMRAHRELTLSSAFTISKDPRHRWWGIQVEFGPELDDILGVTNNKQNAENLTSVAGKTWSDFAEDDETEVMVAERYKEDDYEQYICIQIAHTVNNNIASMWNTIKKTSKAAKKAKRHADSPERRGTEATKKRVEETGKTTDSDDESKDLTKEQRLQRIEKFLTTMKIDPDEINENLGDIMDAGLKYSINRAYLESDAFFSVDGIGGALFITLNRKHSAYKELFDTLGKDVSKSTPQEMEQYLLRANSALMVMLIAWARLEDESSGSNKIRLQDTRNDWGRIARDFLLFGRE